MVLVGLGLSVAMGVACRKQARGKAAPPQPSSTTAPPPQPLPPGPRAPELIVVSEPDLPDDPQGPDMLVLMFGPSAIWVDGMAVAALKNGDLANPGPSGTDVAALDEALRTQRLRLEKLAALTQEPLDSEVTLLVDRDTRFRALALGLRSLGRLGFVPRFAVSTASGMAFLTARLPSADAPHLPPSRVITIHASNWQIQTPGPTKPALLDGHDLDQLRGALGKLPGPMHVIVDDDIPFQVVADTLTAITRASDGSVVREAVLLVPQ